MPLNGLLLTAVLAQTLPGDAITSAPASQPAVEEGQVEGPPTLEQERASNKKLIELEYSQLAAVPGRSISKILNVAIEDGHLHVRPVMGTTAEAVRVDAKEWPGYLQVTVGDAKLLAFHLKHIDVSDATKIVTYTQVMTGPDYLQINRDSEDMQGIYSTTLIQARQFADENELPIRLTIRNTLNDSEKQPPEIRFAAESFQAMRQQYPTEMRKYLLPILRDLGASDVLNSSTPALAWQVLGGAVAVDPKIEAQIKVITQRLNADDFKARAAAEDELAMLGNEAAAVVRRQDLSTLPIDPATALRLFAQKHEPVPPARAAELGKDVQFLLDTLVLDESRLRQAAAEKLQAAMGTAVDLPDSLSAEERAKRVEELRGRFAPATQPAAER